MVPTCVAESVRCEVSGGRHLDGRGKRYFGSLDSHQLLEDPNVAIQGRRVLHLRYRVRR